MTVVGWLNPLFLLNNYFNHLMSFPVVLLVFAQSVFFFYLFLSHKVTSARVDYFYSLSSFSGFFYCLVVVCFNVLSGYTMYKSPAARDCQSRDSLE